MPRRFFVPLVLCFLSLGGDLRSQDAPVTEPATTTTTATDTESLVIIEAGELPFVISAPHGGSREVPGSPAREGAGLERRPGGFVTARDTGTTELARALVEELKRRYSKAPYLVASLAHRRYLDPNRPADQAYEDTDAKAVYDHYHASLRSAVDEVMAKHHRGLLLDIHGQGSDAEVVFRGTKNGLTVERLRHEHGDAAHTGPQSLMGLLATRGWKVHPIPHSEREQAGFTGGYIVQTYGSHQGTGVDAIQLEFGSNYRKPARKDETARVLADALEEYAELYLQLPRRAPSNGPGRTPIAVYTGPGTSASKSDVLRVLQSHSALEVREITADQIRQGTWQGARVLVHPGGSGSKQGEALGKEGREAVRAFVRQGGGFVGVCAGAYLASSDYEWSLGLLDAKVIDRKHWARGHGDVELSITSAGRSLFGLDEDAVSIYYHQGPLLAPAGLDDVPDYAPLATYASEIAENGAPAGVMIGTTAIASATWGDGRVVCFSPHPERTPAVSGMLIHAVNWAAERPAP